MANVGKDTGPLNPPSPPTTNNPSDVQPTDTDLIAYPSKTPLPPSPQTPQPATTPYVKPIGSKDTYGSAYLVPGKANSSPDFGGRPADVVTHEVRQPQILDSAGNQTQSTQAQKKRQRPADKITKGTQ